MRGTIDRAQNMTAKRLRSPLMSSCALAAALLVAGHVRQAHAQAFNAVNPTPTQAGATVTTTSSTSTTVDVTAAQAIIDWQPNGAALAANNGTGTVDFMPAGRSITFESGYGYSGGYTVLNRIDTTTPLTRPIGLDGLITSTVNGQRGGAVWFYSPGGIIAGANSIFNVGSLVLTANAIDTTGGLFSPGGSIRFRGIAGSSSAVTIDNGAQLNLTSANAYLAVVAPVVIQRGAVDINGSAAYVSAERVDITVGSNLFNISVLSGFGSDGDPDGATVDGKRVTIDHSGSTTSTVAATGATDDRRIYFVAVPKNDAITMLVSGTLGYPAATTAGVENGQVILAAGQSVFGNSFGSITATDASLRITGGTITSRVNAFALNQAAIDSSTGNQTITGQVDLTADDAEIHARAGRTVTITGNTTVRGAGRDPSTAGQARATVDAGGTLTINGDLLLDANGDGFFESGYGSLPATAGTGGTAALAVTGAGASATVTGNLTVRAIGTGGGGNVSRGALGTGGDASILASGGGTASVGDSSNVAADGIGGNGGGNGVGGTSSVVADGGTLDAHSLFVSAGGGGGGQGNGLVSGIGTGGTATVSARSAGDITSIGLVSVQASGTGGAGTSADGGAGRAGDAALLADNATFAASGLVYVGGAGQGGQSTDGNGGTGLGGTAALTARAGGSISLNGSILVNYPGFGNAPTSALVVSQGLGGASTNGNGGSGAGGTASIVADSGTVTSLSTTGVDAFGGGGVSQNGTGGIGTGGIASLSAVNGSITSQGNLFINAEAGTIFPPQTTPARDTSGIGGTVAGLADNGTISAAGLFGLRAQGGGTVSLAARGAGGYDAGGQFTVDAGSVQITHLNPSRTTIDADEVDITATGAFNAASSSSIRGADTVDIAAGTTLDAGIVTAIDSDVHLDAVDRISAGTVSAGDSVSVAVTGGPATVATAIAGTNAASSDPDFAGNVGIGASGNVTVGSATALNSVGLLSQTGTVNATTLDAGVAGVVLAGGDVGVGTATVGDLFYVGAPTAAQTLFGDGYVLGQDDDPEVNLDALIAGGITRAGGNVAITGLVTASRLMIGSAGTTTLAASDVSGTAEFDALGALGGTGLRIGGAITATGDSISLVGPGAFDVARADVTGAAGDLTLIAGTTLDAPDLAAGGAITLGGDTGITAGNVQANGDIAAISANGPVTLRDVTSADGSIRVLGGGDVDLGNLAAAGAVNVNSGATATFLGNIAADAISIAASDIVLGTSPTTLIGGGDTASITLTNNGTRPTVVGGADASDAWSLSNAEFGRLSAHTIAVNAPDVPGDADLRIGQLDVIGSAGADTATRRRNLTGSDLIFNSAGTIVVDGAVSVTGTGAGDNVSLVAPDLIQVLTPGGSIAMTGANDALAGTLNLSADIIYVGSAQAFTDSVGLRDVSARSARLGINDGPVNQAGYLQADTLAFRADTGLYIQNSGLSGGAPDTRAGFTTGTGGATLMSLDEPEVVINGRQANRDGTFVTGAALLATLTAQNSGDKFPDVVPGSTINGCVINAPFCGSVESPVPPLQDVVNRVFDPSAFLISLLETPLIELADFVPFSLEPLIDDPVTGAGNEELWRGGEQRDEDKQDGGTS